MRINGNGDRKDGTVKRAKEGPSLHVTGSSIQICLRCVLRNKHVLP